MISFLSALFRSLGEHQSLSESRLNAFRARVMDGVYKYHVSAQ